MPGTTASAAAAAAAAAALVTQTIHSDDIALGQPQTYMYPPVQTVHADDAHRIPREFTGSDAHYAGTERGASLGETDGTDRVR